MTNEEIVFLIKSGENTSENLKILYQQNHGLIMKSAKIFSSVEDIEDLCQEGYFGLVTAVEHWDPGAGVAFSTYAYMWIWSKMKAYVESCGSVIRFPRYQQTRLLKYKSAIRQFQFEFQKEPTPGELASFMGITKEEVEQLKSDAKALSPASLESPIGSDGDGEITLGDTIQDDRNRYEEIEDEIQNEQLGQVLWNIVDRLEDHERKVLKMRYKDGLTLKECGESLGVTTNKAWTIEDKAVKKLRKSRNLRKLSPFVASKCHSIAYRASGLRHFIESRESAPESAVLYLERKNAL